MLKSKKGQAIFELIPAVVVFGMVVFSSLAYYKIIREQQIRMEVVRNLAFAKINNSGPLTTVPEDWGDPLELGTAGTGGRKLNVLGGTQNAPVLPHMSCFRVMAEPANATKSADSPWLQFEGGGAPKLPVQISAWAVVYRRPGGGCF